MNKLFLILITLGFSMTSVAHDEITVRFEPNGNIFEIILNEIRIVDGQDGQSGLTRNFNKKDPKLNEYTQMAKKHGGSIEEIKKGFLLEKKGANSIKVKIIKSSGNNFILKVSSKKAEESYKRHLKSNTVILKKDLERFSDILYKKINSSSKAHKFSF